MKAIFVFALTVCFLVSKGQVYVKSDAQGANDGSSWQNAYTNLDSALKRTSQGQIWVAAGTYIPSVDVSTPFRVYKSFDITKRIGLYGGFKGNETSFNQRDADKNVTILSGDVGVAGVDQDNTPAVVRIVGANINASTVLDGFIITKSYYSNGYDYGNGAVYIDCNYATPIVKNCIIRGGFGFDGGGIYVTRSSPLIENNLITGNTAYEGAGIYMENGASPAIVNNRIINNRCVGGFSNLSGGGIKIEAYCAPYIYGNIIDSNYALHYGGGIDNQSNYAVTIINNVISNNTSRMGAGISIDFSATQITGNLIIRNHALSYGGGIYVDYSYGTASTNNTYVQNYSDNGGGAAYMIDVNTFFINDIVYNNPTKSGKPISVINNNRTDWWPKFDYCNIENGKDGYYFSRGIPVFNVWRTGNIADYPHFIDTAKSNYRLGVQSACTNAGTPDTTGLMLPGFDAAKSDRVIGGRVDIGAYEYHVQALPVKLLQFSTASNRSQATVNWKVEHSYDIQAFYLEKSSDGLLFTQLAAILPLANVTTYAFKDELQKGYNYYRLKVLENDGKTTYSHTNVIRYEPAGSLQVFPNPVLNQLTFTSTSLKSSGNYTVKICTLEGRVLRQTAFTATNGSDIVNVGLLHPGTYLLQVSNGKEQLQEIFIKK